jgi:predicted GH43/DUF377 family glycosyl hydrolase
MGICRTEAEPLGTVSKFIVEDEHSCMRLSFNSSITEIGEKLKIVWESNGKQPP